MVASILRKGKYRPELYLGRNEIDWINPHVTRTQLLYFTSVQFRLKEINTYETR